MTWPEPPLAIEGPCTEGPDPAIPTFKGLKEGERAEGQAAVSEHTAHRQRTAHLARLYLVRLCVGPSPEPSSRPPCPGGLLNSAKQQAAHKRRHQQKTKENFHVGASGFVPGNMAVWIRGRTGATPQPCWPGLDALTAAGPVAGPVAHRGQEQGPGALIASCLPS